MDRHKPMKQGQKEDILSLFSSVYKDMSSVESTAKAARGWQKDTHIQEKPKEGQNGLLSKASRLPWNRPFIITEHNTGL